MTGVTLKFHVKKSKYIFDLFLHFTYSTFIILISPNEFLTHVSSTYSSLNKQEQLMTLDILDYLVDFSERNFIVNVSQKSFVSFLISILKMKDSPEQQMKVLGLLQKWGTKFTEEQELKNFSEIYKTLKNSGVTFPSNYQ